MGEEKVEKEGRKETNSRVGSVSRDGNEADVPLALSD